MLALGRKIPIERGGNVLALESVGQFLARKQAAAVHPGAEIGRNGHVGGSGNDTVRDFGVLTTEFIEQPAKSRLCRHHRLDRDLQFRWHRDVPGPVTAAARGKWHMVEKRL